MRELDRKPLGDGLNYNYFVQDPDGTTGLLRVAQPDRSESDHILRSYYDATGFTTTDQGHVSLRSAQEQYEFTRHAAMAGLAVLPPLSLTGNSLVFPYLGSAQPLLEYLTEDRSDARGMLPAILADMRQAHRLGFIYGDRSCGNILVDTHGIINIDFDLSLGGPTAREFDVADLLMHLHYQVGVDASILAATTLGIMCAQTPKWLDIDRVTTYLRRMGELLYSMQWFDAIALHRQEMLIGALKTTGTTKSVS